MTSARGASFGTALLIPAAASDQDVIFADGGDGTLKLDAGSNFTGSVSGFDADDGLDLRNLLEGEHGGGVEANLADYLNFSSGNGGEDTVLQVSSHGGGAAGIDQTFELQGVDGRLLRVDERRPGRKVINLVAIYNQLGYYQ